MTRRRILAVGGPGPLPEGVTGVAAALAVTLHAGVEQCHLPSSPADDGPGAGRENLIRAAGADDVAGVVVDNPGGAVDWALHLAAAIDRPIVFAPRATASPFALERVLVPLDGSARAIEAVSEAASLAREVGADVIVLHCVHGASVPRFEDHPQYDPGDWTRELAARFTATLGEARVEVRIGRAEDIAADFGSGVGANLVVLAWNREPAPGRARTVRAILEHSEVPVMLLPKGQPGSVIHEPR